MNSTKSSIQSIRKNAVHPMWKLAFDIDDDLNDGQTDLNDNTLYNVAEVRTGSCGNKNKWSVEHQQVARSYESFGGKSHLDRLDNEASKVKRSEHLYSDDEIELTNTRQNSTNTDQTEPTNSRQIQDSSEQSNSTPRHPPLTVGGSGTSSTKAVNASRADYGMHS